MPTMQCSVGKGGSTHAYAACSLEDLWPLLHMALTGVGHGACDPQPLRLDFSYSRLSGKAKKMNELCCKTVSQDPSQLQDTGYVCFMYWEIMQLCPLCALGSWSGPTNSPHNQNHVRIS